MADIQPRPVCRTTLPRMDATEVVTYDQFRTAVRHAERSKLELARCERDPNTLRHIIGQARGVEIRASERVREMSLALYEVAKGDA